MVSSIRKRKDPYNEGDWILVSHGRWSRSIIVEDDDLGEVEVRKIDLDEILAWSDEKPDDVNIGN